MMKFALLLLFLVAAKLLALDHYPRTVLISVDGLSSELIKSDSLLSNISSSSIYVDNLSTVFPAQSLPVNISAVTGCISARHGIMADYFYNRINGEMFSSNTANQGQWYWSTFIWEKLRRYGISTAAIDFPGAGLDTKYRNPAYSIRTDGALPSIRDTLIGMLNMPEGQGPRLYLVHYTGLDNLLHRHRSDSLTKAELLKIGLMISEIRDTLISDSLPFNLILYSGYNHTNIDSSQIVQLDSLLIKHGAPYDNYGSFAIVYPVGKADSIAALIEQEASGPYEVHTKYTPNDVTGFMDHPYFSGILLTAKPGHIFTDSKSQPRLSELKTAHGYKEDTGVLLWVIHDGSVNSKPPADILQIYSLICRIYGIDSQTP